MHNANNYLPPRASHQVIVKSLKLSEVGGFNQQYVRPYQTNVTESTIQQIGSRVDSLGSPGATVAPSTLSGIASGVVAPSSMHLTPIQIPNGWREPRLSFVLEVEVFTSVGTQYREFYMGFTNYLGIGNSMNNYIDPNMEFIINSYTRLSTIRQMTPHGPVEQEVIQESNHIFNGMIFSQDEHFVNGSYMRPQDIFGGIQHTRLQDMYTGLGNPHDNLLDTRSVINRGSQVSRRTNTIPTNYLSTIIDRHRQAKAFLDYGQDEGDLYARGIDYSRESMLQDNPFLSAIASVTGRAASASFRIGDLQALPGSEQLTVTALRKGDTTRTVLPDAANSQHWEGADNETIIANVLSTALPAILSSLLIMQVSFSITNMTQTGEVHLSINDFKSFTNADIRRNFDILRQRLDMEVMRDLSYNNTLPYHIRVDCSLVYGSQINVSINSGPRVEFSTPTFSDSLIVPVVTGDRSLFNNMITDMDTLISRTGLDTTTGGMVGF